MPVSDCGLDSDDDCRSLADSGHGAAVGKGLLNLNVSRPLRDIFRLIESHLSSNMGCRAIVRTRIAIILRKLDKLLTKLTSELPDALSTQKPKQPQQHPHVVRFTLHLLGIWIKELTSTINGGGVDQPSRDDAAGTILNFIKAIELLDSKVASQDYSRGYCQTGKGHRASQFHPAGKDTVGGERSCVFQTASKQPEVTQSVVPRQQRPVPAIQKPFKVIPRFYRFCSKGQPDIPAMPMIRPPDFITTSAPCLSDKRSLEEGAKRAVVRKTNTQPRSPSVSSDDDVSPREGLTDIMLALARDSSDTNESDVAVPARPAKKQKRRVMSRSPSSEAASCIGRFPKDESRTVVLKSKPDGAQLLATSKADSGGILDVAREPRQQRMTSTRAPTPANTPLEKVTAVVTRARTPATVIFGKVAAVARARPSVSEARTVVKPTEESAVRENGKKRRRRRNRLSDSDTDDDDGGDWPWN